MDRADAARAAGEPLAAIDALDIAAVWSFEDVHAATRLADAWLELTPATPASRSRRVRALFEVVDPRSRLFSRFPPRTYVWSEERRKDVVERARRALDGL